MLNFDNCLNKATTSEQCWRALQDFAESLVGAQLFTVMTVDMPKLLARRVYSSHPLDYPVSGTKPIVMDHWFDIVHRQQRIFVANTITEIAEVFPDHEKIWSLGCGSVVNLPVIIDNDLVATINLLHQEQHYTPARVDLISLQLSQPAHSSYLRVNQLDSQ